MFLASASNRLAMHIGAVQIGAIQPGEEKAVCRPHGRLPVPEGGVQG